MGKKIPQSATENMNWCFCTSVYDLENLPQATIPEVAVWGRSNVGKSSLINGLSGTNNMAKTSNTPGRTQALNFFIVNQSFYLVDMPGYGYAKAPKSLVESWNLLVIKYLTERSNLRKIYLLIDSRHGIKKNDIEKMCLLDNCGVAYQIVLTKIDKISKSQQNEWQELLPKELAKHPAASAEIILTSYNNSQTFKLVWANILESIIG